MSSKRFIVAASAALVAGLAASVLSLTPASPAQAASKIVRACSPLTFHDERRIGNKCCFSDHSHAGSGGTQESKQAAMQSAANAWADFVNFEYGGAYDNFSIAVNKSFNCSGSGRAWSCTVEASPCH
jgi:hypothetical protein